MKTIGGVAIFRFSHFSVGRLFLINVRAPGGYFGSFLGAVLGPKINKKSEPKQGGQKEHQKDLYPSLGNQSLAHLALGAGPLDMIYRTVNTTKTRPYDLTRRGPEARRICSVIVCLWLFDGLLMFC